MSVQVAYLNSTKNSTKCIPLELSRPEFHITGHASIVNTALFHPTLPLLATAGIENDILIHSPTETTPFSEQPLPLTPTEVRHLGDLSAQTRASIRRALILGTELAMEGYGEDEVTRMRFDECVPFLAVQYVIELLTEVFEGYYAQKGAVMRSRQRRWRV